ncbi:LamB/YcsF family protein [Gemmata sp. G18]|uniref:LamB/YcsF family protein n=1 Tax=Gemmata palustris TaxID=2822762 RepID=A0ABS5BYV2_9BACT|nr:5-oxoprolinase subunit PxpA [Gemmata palustris]MBP3958879.1 LamB/YcsF family protein [Gemmata palustris]
MEIDLNADLGEGAGFDAELMPLITSANVCCGAHAGGPNEIASTLALAKQFGVTIGAHPGYADREHFGRRELDLTSGEIAHGCLYQLGALMGLAKACDAEVRYVKPHGALYNQACRDENVAVGVIDAAKVFELPVIGLPQSWLEAEATDRVPFFAEGFADRRYRPDGSLVPRTEPNAFVHDPDEAVKQIEWLVREKGVRTICVHGDNPDAVAFTKAVRAALLKRGFTLKAFA